MPLKILLLTWDFPPTLGGIQSWMHRLARDIPDARVRVLAPSVPGDAAFDRTSGLEIRRLGSARLGPALWLAQLTARTLLTCIVWRPDLVLCGHVIAAPAALLARRLTGVPYAVVAHGYEIRRRRRRQVLAHLLRRARLVVANSEFTKSVVLGLGVARERIRILHPGVDPGRFFPSHEGAGPNEFPWVLSVSRLADPYKGHDTVIRALPLIRSKVPDTRYYIAGDGPLRPYLERVAASVGVSDAVTFLTRVNDDALLDLYRTADVLMALSRETADGGAEGFGIVCLEAAACGLPVVAGRSGGLRDAVEDGVTGILVDPTDIGAVAEAVVSLLMDPVRARAMGETGRNRVLERFTWQKVLAETRRVLEESVAG